MFFFWRRWGNLATVNERSGLLAPVRGGMAGPDLQVLATPERPQEVQAQPGRALAGAGDPPPPPH